MRRRKGFGAYIRKLEGREVPVQRKHYAMPEWMKPESLRYVSVFTNNHWLEHAFTWTDTVQGHSFWFLISISRSEADYDLANEIIESWEEQLGA